MRKAFSNKNGVTLIELLVVMAIIALLVIISPMMAQLIREERVSAVTRELLGRLQQARMDAMTQAPTATSTRGFGIRLVSAQSYVVFRFTDPDGNFQYGGAGEEADTVTVNMESPNVSLAFNGAVPNNVLIFDRTGYPRNANWGFLQTTIVITHAEANPPITQRCVSVSFNRIRGGTWNGACTEQ